MSYSIDEWFDEHVIPSLHETLKKIEANKDLSNCDIFLDQMRVIFENPHYEYRKDQFATMLLKILLGEDQSLHVQIEKCFDRLVNEDDSELMSFVYRHMSDKITCELNAIKDEDS